MSTDDLKGAARFKLPLVEGRVVGGTAGTRMPTARNLEDLQKQAYEEGFASGRQAGYEAGLVRAVAETGELRNLLTGLFDDLAEPFARLDEDVVRAVADLALLVARQLVRRELRADPGEVVAVVREAIRQLPVASRNPFIRLNPEDIDLVRTALAIGEEVRAWRLEPDPLVTRGGCLVETDSSRIDARVETRLAAIASKLLGGEREGD